MVTKNLTFPFCLAEIEDRSELRIYKELEMLKRSLLVLVSLGFLVGCVGCDAVSIVADSLGAAGTIVGWFN
jgi:hypothetical protein